MTKFCVKKPFTVLVGIIMVLVLGVISFTRITTDLLPQMSLPYIIAVTTYPGASPEKVESSVTEVLEGSLGVVNGVKSVSSTSAENYSMVMLEFEEDTNMDSAMVKLSTAAEQLGDSLPEGAGSPMFIEVSPDMLATVTLSIDKENTSIQELSKLVDDEIIPYLERREGVASINPSGLVTQMVEVRLSSTKVDELNDKVLAKVDGEFAKAKEELDKQSAAMENAKQELASGQEALSEQKEATYGELAVYSKMMDEAMAQAAAYDAQLTNLKAQKAALEMEKKAYEEQLLPVYEGINDALKLYGTSISDILKDESQQTFEKIRAFLIQAGSADPQLKELAGQFTWENLNTMEEKVSTRIPQIETALANLEIEIQTSNAVKDQVDAAVKQAKDNYANVEKGKMEAVDAFGQYSDKLSQGESQMTSAKTQLESAKKEYESARETAIESADISQLLSMDTLSEILTAQNFTMPAGYISQDETQYLLKIGEEITSLDELKNLLLVNMEGIGDVRLADVADITVLDNADESYAKINSNPAVVLSITKSSTAGTSAVSKEVEKAVEELNDMYEGLNITYLMDQGDYIEMIVNSVLSNLILGALLAIIVLAIFLKDAKPTVVVAFSIPLSVLFAIVLMYFSNVTINMISLSGLALGVGMLVDNSIVVIENIYRLRNQGVPAARAAVQGAKQVSGAILASTLTTICVFLPIVFTDGLTRQLFTDMGLTIAYSLLASLVVALTVVPSMSSTVLKNTKEKKHSWFDAMIRAYEKAIRFCLRRKAVPLLASALLFVFAVWQASRMGLEMIPEMTSDSMSAVVAMNEEVDDEEACEAADAIMEKVEKIKGVDKVGAMAGNMTAGISTQALNSVAGADFGSFMFYILLDEDGVKDVEGIAAQVAEAAKGQPCEIEVQKSQMDMSMLGGEGMQLEITGEDLDEILSVSNDMKELLGKVEGFEEITNGQEDADTALQLILDKDEAMRFGLTAAQIYAELAKALTTEQQSVKLTLDGEEYQIVIVNDTEAPNVDNLLNYELETTKQGLEGEESEMHKLSEFATVEEKESVAAISRENLTRYMTVTASTKEGYNTSLLSRQVQELLDEYEAPEGVEVTITGEAQNIEDSMIDLMKMIALAIVFIYLIMVAQFQSLLSPFIVLFTIPLAFTGGLLALLMSGEKISIIAMMGFLVLAGVIVNNGIVFVDYVNQLRLEGREKKEALVEAGKTRMRPILMTALTTILAMSTMVFGNDMGSEMGKGMAIVTIGGLVYATFMTLFIVPVLYDILFRRQLRKIDVGDEKEEQEG